MAAIRNLVGKDMALAGGRDAEKESFRLVSVVLGKREPPAGGCEAAKEIAPGWWAEGYSLLGFRA